MKPLAPLLCGLLMGCSGLASAPYWTPRDKPVPVVSEMMVADVTQFCGPMRQGHKRGGCFVEVLGYGLIYLQRPGELRPDIRITEEQADCAKRHERAHATHVHDDRTQHSWNCGPEVL